MIHDIGRLAGTKEFQDAQIEVGILTADGSLRALPPTPKSSKEERRAFSVALCRAAAIARRRLAERN
jgi:superfamily I DNA/RNA helicase